MTTQDHGYTVSEPSDLKAVTRQYHPEANPGPHDTLGFFDDVVKLVKTPPRP